MNRDQIWERIYFGSLGAWSAEDRQLNIIEAIVREATQAERHRIYAALEADPGALWRDQGFQEWRAKKSQETNND